MDLLIRMRIICNVQNRKLFEIGRQIRNFANQFAIWSESQYLLYSQRKSLYCRKLSAFVVDVIIWHIFVAKQGQYHKEKPLVIETKGFTIESLVFQNSHLNNSHSISDINILVYRIMFYLCQLLNLVLK